MNQTDAQLRLLLFAHTSPYAQQAVDELADIEDPSERWWHLFDHLKGLPEGLQRDLHYAWMDIDELTLEQLHQRAYTPTPPTPATRTFTGGRRAALLAAVGVTVFGGVVAGFAMQGSASNATPGPGWTPCGTSGAMCPPGDAAQGQAADPGGSANITNCMSHDFGDGTISVNAYFAVSNPDTADHTYRVTVQGWQGFGAHPQVAMVSVPAGQTVREMASFSGSNAALPNEPYPQPACAIEGIEQVS